MDKSVFTQSNTTSVCPWKGTSSYYNINVDGTALYHPWPHVLIPDEGTELKDAAWYYPQPKEKAQHIKDHVAFCKSTTKRRKTIETNSDSVTDKTKVNVSLTA